MELMKREFLTVTDDGDDICMTLDTSHKTVQEIGRKMAEIRSGLLMDGKVGRHFSNTIWMGITRHCSRI